MSRIQPLSFYLVYQPLLGLSVPKNFDECRVILVHVSKAFPSYQQSSYPTQSYLQVGTSFQKECSLKRPQRGFRRASIFLTFDIGHTQVCSLGSYFLFFLGDASHKQNGIPLFVFSINGPQQNARSLLTPVSDTDFYALSRGTLQFVLHGSSNNRLFQRF